eukprot:m.132378 g.132378  ORF g.132378 m.132378 type:complete len:398 (-) comp11333_c0_seq1:1741-2934(-)
MCPVMREIELSQPCARSAAMTTFVEAGGNRASLLRCRCGTGGFGGRALFGGVECRHNHIHGNRVGRELPQHGDDFIHATHVKERILQLVRVRFFIVHVAHQSQINHPRQVVEVGISKRTLFRIPIVIKPIIIVLVLFVIVFPFIVFEFIVVVPGASPHLGILAQGAVLTNEQLGNFSKERNFLKASRTGRGLRPCANLAAFFKNFIPLDGNGQDTVVPTAQDVNQRHGGDVGVVLAMAHKFFMHVTPETKHGGERISRRQKIKRLLAVHGDPLRNDKNHFALASRHLQRGQFGQDGIKNPFHELRRHPLSLFQVLCDGDTHPFQRRLRVGRVQLPTKGIKNEVLPRGGAVSPRLNVVGIATNVRTHAVSPRHDDRHVVRVEEHAHHGGKSRVVQCVR